MKCKRVKEGVLGRVGEEGRERRKLCRIETKEIEIGKEEEGGSSGEDHQDFIILKATESC